MRQMASLAAMRRKARRAIVEAAQSASWFVAFVDDGSASEGRGDEWSDLDVTLCQR